MIAHMKGRQMDTCRVSLCSLPLCIYAMHQSGMGGDRGRMPRGPAMLQPTTTKSVFSGCLCLVSEPHSLANCSLLCALLARLLGAGRALTRRLERRPLDGGDALLEACRTRPRE